MTVKARNSAIARAALRKLAGRGGGLRPAASPTAGDRPRVDFLDPLHRCMALRAKGIGITAFLITLAAFQRGLGVTFHYELASSNPRFATARLQGHRGELFSITNGSRTHAFSLSMGDKTALAASAVAEDKHLTKLALRRAGIRVPDRIIVSRSQASMIEAFVDRRPGRRFVVKPFDGSLGRGVEVDLPPSEVLPALQRQQGARVVVEEFIAGSEFRATVVGDRCVAVSQRSRAAVTGDGRSSIAALLAAENQARATHPHMEPLSDTAAIAAFLARSALSLASVPESGEVVQLGNTAVGNFHADVTDTIAPAVKAAAVAAVQACMLPNGGVDLIVADSGEVVVLEVNQRSWIAQHSFPRVGHGRGNGVAEALIDFYFPETVSSPTHPTLTYDFAAICAALASSQLADVSLPVVGPDWQVMRFIETGATAPGMAKALAGAARMSGVFFTRAALPEGGVGVCLAYARPTFARFLNNLPPGFRARVFAHAQGQAA